MCPRPLPALVLLCVLGLAAAPVGTQSQLVEQVDYAGSGDPDQSLDLFLPDAEGSGGPPLLVFVHSRFWGAGERGRDIAHRLARPLQRTGAAVAIVRHRPAPEYPHPAGAEDVALLATRCIRGNFRIRRSYGRRAAVSPGDRG
jgi:acetyl esterase/lipase